MPPSSLRLRIRETLPSLLWNFLRLQSCRTKRKKLRQHRQALDEAAAALGREMSIMVPVAKRTGDEMNVSGHGSDDFKIHA